MSEFRIAVQNVGDLSSGMNRGVEYSNSLYESIEPLQKLFCSASFSTVLYSFHHFSILVDSTHSPRSVLKISISILTLTLLPKLL